MRQILVDLDGVLADLVGGALRAHGLSTDFPLPAGDYHLGNYFGLGEGRFWAKLQGPDFWANLEPLPDFDAVLHLCSHHAGGPENVCLLSSPNLDPRCVEGKLRWIRMHLLPFERRYLFGSAKHFAAGPERLLVDDSDANVEAYRAAGGPAFLLPRAWNSRHAEAPEALLHLGEALRGWSGREAVAPLPRVWLPALTPLEQEERYWEGA